MANDTVGQTIPSWVEDNSYEVYVSCIFTTNEGHTNPCSIEQFRTFWKTHYEGMIVRDGKVKDNSSFDGKFWVDPNRNYYKVEELPENLNTTGSSNADGNPMAMVPTVAGVNNSDTTNYGITQWIGNSGLDAYAPPMTFWIDDTEVTKNDLFTSIKKGYIFRHASDYKKSVCNEYNPIETVAIRTLPQQTSGPATISDSDYEGHKIPQDTNLAPDSSNPHLQEQGVGETFVTKLTCANDLMVSAIGLKYKMEWEKNSNTAITDEVHTWLIANGYGRSSIPNNVWVTHTPKVIGQARLMTECYDFVGGARVSTTLQDINSGVFGLPSGHPILSSTKELQGAIDFKHHFPDETGYNDGTQVIKDSDQITFGS
tara:strand:- start:377 stop:1486 length:1110 start_codon:yes stop_codon:yes gene_type:complete